MSYCEHCEGQRFDRARVLRALRQLQKELGTERRHHPDDVIDRALKAIKTIDIPHLELIEDEEEEDEVVH